MIAPQSFKLERARRNIGSAEKPIWYLDVVWREQWFREDCPGGQISTKLIHLDTETLFEREDEEKVWDASAWKGQGGWRKTGKLIMKSAKGFAVVQAHISTGEGSVEAMKMCKAVDFRDFLEKAETGAIGRALGKLGYTISK